MGTAPAETTQTVLIRLLIAVVNACDDPIVAGVFFASCRLSSWRDLRLRKALSTYTISAPHSF